VSSLSRIGSPGFSLVFFLDATAVLFLADRAVAGTTSFLLRFVPAQEQCPTVYRDDWTGSVEACTFLKKYIIFQIRLITMQTITISDELYENIMLRRVGRESISKVLERELLPIDSRVLELEKLKTEKRYKVSEI